MLLLFIRINIEYIYFILLFSAFHPAISWPNRSISEHIIKCHKQTLRASLAALNISLHGKLVNGVPFVVKGTRRFHKEQL